MTAKNNLKASKPNTAAFIVRLFAPIIWICIIFWLSLTPSPPQLPGILGWDKLLHAGAYGLLALLIAQFLICFLANPANAWWQAGLAAVGFGALLEILQLLAQTGRTAEWWDLFADVVGVFLCCVIFRQLAAPYCQRYEPLDKKHG